MVVLFVPDFGTRIWKLQVTRRSRSPWGSYQRRGLRCNRTVDRWLKLFLVALESGVFRLCCNGNRCRDLRDIALVDCVGGLRLSSWLLQIFSGIRRLSLPLRTHDNSDMFRLNLMPWDIWRFLTLLLRGCADLLRSADRLSCEGRWGWSIGSRRRVFAWKYEYGQRTTDNGQRWSCADNRQRSTDNGEATLTTDNGQRTTVKLRWQQTTDNGQRTTVCPFF